MSRSKFDPLDMALNSLATRPADKGEPAPAARHEALPDPSPSVPSITSDRTAAVPARRRRTATPAPTAGGGKTQLNIYLPVDSAAELRQAVVDLGQRHSLGDLVARLISDHLAGLVTELAAEASTAPARLRGGRKVSRGVAQ